MKTMKKIHLKPVFVKTKNVRNFEVMMDALSLNEDEGCFGMVFGRAGRGKSRTAQWYSGHNDCVYLKILKVWKSSELDFLKALCSAAGIVQPPKRKGAAFAAIVEAMIDNPRPVFLDEIEKMLRDFIDVIRDLAEATGLPFILMGEEELVSYMRRDRRVWSRTFRQLEYKPIEIADILLYTQESIGQKMSIDIASLLHKSSGGDWRPVKRAVLGMAHYLNSNPDKKITMETARAIVDSGLTGRK